MSCNPGTGNGSVTGAIVEVLVLPVTLGGVKIFGSVEGTSIPEWVLYSPYRKC